MDVRPVVRDAPAGRAPHHRTAPDRHRVPALPASRATRRLFPSDHGLPTPWPPESSPSDRCTATVPSAPCPPSGRLPAPSNDDPSQTSGGARDEHHHLASRARRAHRRWTAWHWPRSGQPRSTDLSAPGRPRRIDHRRAGTCRATVLTVSGTVQNSTHAASVSRQLA